MFEDCRYLNPASTQGARRPVSRKARCQARGKTVVIPTQDDRAGAVLAHQTRMHGSVQRPTDLKRRSEGLRKCPVPPRNAALIDLIAPFLIPIRTYNIYGFENGRDKPLTKGWCCG